jgi:hypothetical protein
VPAHQQTPPPERRLGQLPAIPLEPAPCNAFPATSPESTPSTSGMSQCCASIPVKVSKLKPTTPPPDSSNRPTTRPSPERGLVSTACPRSRTRWAARFFSKGPSAAIRSSYRSKRLPSTITRGSPSARVVVRSANRPAGPNSRANTPPRSFATLPAPAAPRATERCSSTTGFPGAVHRHARRLPRP